jgi:hypothetical protein
LLPISLAPHFSPRVLLTLEWWHLSASATWQSLRTTHILVLLEVYPTWIPTPFSGHSEPQQPSLVLSPIRDQLDTCSKPLRLS